MSDVAYLRLQKFFLFTGGMLTALAIHHLLEQFYEMSAFLSIYASAAVLAGLLDLTGRKAR